MNDTKAKILCVDDDPDLLLINSSILQLAGYEVLSATTGTECLARLKEERPDLILLDVNLPDMSGIDICREIKRNPDFLGTYVILISGIRTSPDSQVEGLEMGADGYIVRPISGQELIARVHAMMRIKGAETALRKSKEQYQMLVELMNEGLGVVDENGNIVYVNNKLYEMFGLSRVEIVGRPLTDFLDNCNQAIFQEQFAKRKKNINDPYELTWQRTDGVMVYAIVSPQSIFDEKGNFKGGFAIITDITERKQMEHLLKEKMERLDLAQRAAKIGIFEWHIPTGSVTCSKEFEHLHGMPSHGFRGNYKSLLDTIHPEDRPSVKRIWMDMIEKKEDCDIEFRIITPDRTIRWLSSRCNIFYDKNGEPVRILGINIDITELKKAADEIKKLNEELEQRVVDRTKQLRTLIEELEDEILEHKQTEAALKESEEKFRAITCAATDAIILIDEWGKISFWNHAAERMFGYSEHEAVGKDLHQFLAPEEYLEVFKEGFSRFREYGEGSFIGKPVEFLAVRKDRTKFPVEISKSVVKVKGKKEAVGIIRDITERKLDEATLLQYAKRLQTLSGRLLEMQEEERKSLSLELHERIGRHLTALKISLEEMKCQPSGNVNESLNTALAITENLLSNFKDMSLNLHQSMLDNLGLLPALKWYFDRYTRMTNVNVHFEHAGIDARFPAEIETAAYRFIQEALSNVAHHACANEVKVLVSAEKNRLVLNIEDSGKGFDIYTVKTEMCNMGIHAMYDRITSSGGQLLIDSAQGSGTRLKAFIPLKDKA